MGYHAFGMDTLVTFFETLDTVYVLLGVLLLLALYILYLDFKLRRFTKGKNGKNLEAVITKTIERQDDLEKFREELERYLDTVEKRIRKSAQGVYTVRFNAFPGTGDGGNQSFATAVIDQNGDGVIVSSLYARDRVSIFAKPVAAFKSEHDLSEEEQKALTGATERMKR